MKKLMVKLGFIIILISIVAILQGCKDKGTNAVTSDKGTLTGTLTLPYAAPNKVVFVAIDNDYNGDNGMKYSYSGNCGSGTTVNYTINNVTPGTYYVYAAVFIESDGSSGPQNGDFIGIYGGSFDNPPATPNVKITSGGTGTQCNFELSVMGVTTIQGSLNGTLTLPYAVPNKALFVAIDNDYNGDNGVKYSYSGNCGSSTTVDYSINNVNLGTYYVYAAVFVKSDGSSGPQNGDFIGIYGGTFDNPPPAPNVTITSGGTGTACSFALSVKSDTIVPASNSLSFNTNEGNFSASGIFDSTATTGSGAGWYDNKTIAAYNFYSSTDGSIAMIMFNGTLNEQTYSMPTQVIFTWALHFNPNDINTLQDKICLSTSGSLNLSTYNSSQAKGTFSGSGYYTQNTSHTVSFSDGIFDLAIMSNKVSNHLPRKINSMIKRVLENAQGN